MAEAENYVTKRNPTIEDWLEYNDGYFQTLKGTADEDVRPSYAPLTDIDTHAMEVGMSTEELYEQVKERVGPLGRAALQLVHSGMDDAWHVVVGVDDEAGEPTL